MRKFIPLDEMRERVASLIYRDDWIRALTDAEWKLLKDHPLIPRDILRTDGSTIRLDHVDRVPRHLAPKVDCARGRAYRLDAQRVTIDTWLQDHGLPVDPRRAGDRKAFNAAIRAAQPRKANGARPPGPPPVVLKRVVGEIRADLDAEKFTADQLRGMKPIALAKRYSCSRETVQKARQLVLQPGRKKYFRQFPTRNK